MTNKKAKGKRAKSRSKMRRKKRRITTNRLLSSLKENSSVQIDIDSSAHAGMPSHRFQGLTGRVKGKQGNAYLVEVNKGNLKKNLVVHAVHLKSHTVDERK